jgi:hypothetical protein
LLELCAKAGLEVEVVAERRWDALPIARKKLAPAFRGLDDEDLLVRELEILLRPAETEASA